MGYWYIKAKITEDELDGSGFFDKYVQKTTYVEGKVVGVTEQGHNPRYLVATKEGKNPEVVMVSVDGDCGDRGGHKILELTYRRK